MTSLRTTREGQDFIARWEGRPLKAYLCPAKVPTIGRGITTEGLLEAGATIAYTDGIRARRVILNKSITAEEESRLFRDLLDRWEDQVEALIKVPVTDDQFDALVSLAWNIGIGALSRSTVLRRLNRGDYEGAAAAFGLFNQATVDGKRQVVRGLVLRRAAERQMFEGDVARARIAAITAGDRAEPLPQRVAPPAPPKSMAKSKTGNAALAGGGLGIASAWGAVQGGLDLADGARERAGQAGALFGLDGHTALLAGAGLIIAALCAFIWWDRRRKLTQELV